jgi:hypothetical protein
MKKVFISVAIFSTIFISTITYGAGWCGKWNITDTNPLRKFKRHNVERICDIVAVGELDADAKDEILDERAEKNYLKLIEGVPGAKCYRDKWQKVEFVCKNYSKKTHNNLYIVETCTDKKAYASSLGMAKCLQH